MYYSEPEPKKPSPIIASILKFLGWVLILWWFIGVLAASRTSQIIPSMFAGLFLLIMGIALILIGVVIRRIIDTLGRDIQQLTRELSELKRKK